MGISKMVDKVKHEIEVILGDETKDKTYASENAFRDEQAAQEAFTASVRKLFDVNGWSNLPGLNSEFKLYDSAGQPKPNGEPQVGDYIRINIPGPTSENWVQVTDRHQGDTRAEFTVKPSPDPTESGEREQGEIDHFFAKEASSTFRVERQGNQLRAFEIGKNERPNNQGKEAGNRAITNTLVATGGWMFFQQVQWEKLTDYLVHL
ncbi:hypothetical protein GCM10023187_34060 [Nibrella viscosa]|uniref:Uncharacterized protein n=1 Tax=Nibrella viscosa TaxID=1084524 RepID=A0ABP8KMA1_9BACT